MFTDIAPFRVNQPLGYQSMNRVRDDIFTLAAARFQHFLGGARATAMAATAGIVMPVDYLDIELDSTQLIGLSCQLRVECRAASGTVTPVLRNITDAIDVVSGTACSATAADYSGANQVQTIPVTLSPGLKKYRLQGNQSAAAGSFLIGYLELYYPSNVVSIGSANFNYVTTLTAPPLSAQIRFDAAAPYTAITKIFVSSTSVPGADVHAALMVILPGSVCYIEDLDNHLQWARFETLASPIDHSTYVELPVKWSANGTALATANEVRFYAPSAGGQALPHHQSHETGGTDAITKLDGAVIQTGTIADTHLSPNVALVTRVNHFTQWQYLDGQSLVCRDLSAAVGSKDFRLHYASGYLDFESLNETTSAPVGPPGLRLLFGGTAAYVQTLHVQGGNASVYLLDTGVAANTGQFRIMSQSSKLIFYKQDDAESGYVNLMNLDRVGNMVVAGQINAATVVASGSVQASGNVVGATFVANGHIYSFPGYIWPGRIVDAAQNTQFYLASHPSYGLYSNTGLYLASANLTVAAGSVYAAGNITCAGLLQGIQQPRMVNLGAGNGGFTPDMNTTDMVTHDAIATASGGCAFGNPANPRDGQTLVFRIRDQGGTQVLVWDGHYIAGGAQPIPTQTVSPAKTMHLGFRYSAYIDRWLMLALSVEP